MTMTTMTNTSHASSLALFIPIRAFSLATVGRFTPQMKSHQRDERDDMVRRPIGEITAYYPHFADSNSFVSCGILMAVTMKISVFWHVTTCNLRNSYQRSGGNVTCSFSVEEPTLQMERIGFSKSSETLVTVYKATRRHIH
jgi:hypothetical protein